MKPTSDRDPYLWTTPHILIAPLFGVIVRQITMVGTRSGQGVSDGGPPLDRGYYEDDALARSDFSEAEAASGSNPRRPLS